MGDSLEERRGYGDMTWREAGGGGVSSRREE